MLDEPTASIVIPTRRRPAYLDVALRSLAPQAAALNAEIIVVEYPELFPGGLNPTSACAQDAAISISPADETMINQFGIDVDRFHAGCVERAERFPQALLTTMTHDAKRSADVRARIAMLS